MGTFDPFAMRLSLAGFVALACATGVFAQKPPEGTRGTPVGVPYDTLKDVDGKAFGTELWKVGSRQGGGTVEYKWKNPVSGVVETKISVVRKVGTDVCGVGAYKAGA